ncbi:hypothetical protein FI667_g11639, partial [Globisporangium splendens]
MDACPANAPLNDTKPRLRCGAQQHEVQRLHHRHLRGVLLADGTTINCFRKNTHETHTIVLERSGHTYTYIHPDGTQTRHLSPTTLSSHRAIVIETINLRNRFAWQMTQSGILAYVHRALCQYDGSEATTNLVRPQRRDNVNRTLLRARWPTGQFYTQTLFDAIHKRFEIRSIEGHARVCLHPSGTLVDVYYVVRVKSSVETDEALENDNVGDPVHMYYTAIQQTFTVHHTPECFAYPVRVLLHAHTALRDNLPDFQYMPQETESAISVLPENGAFAARPSFAALATSHRQDGDAANDANSGLALADVLRVATLPTKKMYQRVVVEVKEEATFLMCRPGDTVAPSVICTNGFFRWYGESGQLQQQFTIETIPPASFFSSLNASSSPDVLSLCNHAMHLLKASNSASFRVGSHASLSAAAEATSLPVSDSNEVVETVENEHGQFRAFADGRVRVVFPDRTILQVNRDQDLCSFTYADGSAGQTTVSAAPAPEQVYIHRALEFADWAFASPEERMARFKRRQLSEEVAQREMHKIGVRFGMNQATSAHERSDNWKCATGATTATTEGDANGTEATGCELSLSMIRQVQEATQQHIASVNRLLHAANE